MLSPLREPVYAASARTLSGSLAEMERIIGEALFSGYVGYNGRAPGSAAKKEELSESGERNKSGGDARHTLVAYFEIVELASILCMDRETTNLAIRTFRHTANNTSLRNRNVESLATAAFVSASERRWLEYQEWLKEKNATIQSEGASVMETNADSAKPPSSREWPTPPRHLTIEEISTAANLDANEVLRYLKVVNVALRKQRPENSSSITTHMPTFCRRLDLPEKTRRLAIGIAEKAMQNNICSRRNPTSISASAIYLACQLEGIRKTQTEICRATRLTEVTLRKVHKELNQEHATLMPDWYHQGESNETEATSAEGSRPFARPALRPSSQPLSQVEEDKRFDQSGEHAESMVQENKDLSIAQKGTGISLVPPPLPPGFGKKQSSSKTKNELPSAPTSTQAAMPTPTSNPMLAMLNNPAMQAFANAFSMMPQLIPPPPPPLPPSLEPASTTSQPDELLGTLAQVETAGSLQPSQSSTGESLEGSGPRLTTNPQHVPNVPSAHPPQPAGNLMAGVQSMMGMVQAMQAFQAMQSKAAPEPTAGAPAEQVNAFTMMAMAMAQAQNGGGMVPGTTPQPSQNHTDPSQDASRTTLTPAASGPEAKGTTEEEKTQLEQ